MVGEALQDTFVAFWRDAAKYSGAGPVSGWLWGIAARRLVGILHGRIGRIPVDRHRLRTPLLAALCAAAS